MQRIVKFGVLVCIVIVSVLAQQPAEPTIPVSPPLEEPESSPDTDGEPTESPFLAPSDTGGAPTESPFVPPVQPPIPVTPFAPIDNSPVSSKCSAHTDCTSCAQEWTCVWCQSTQTCVDGQFYGATTCPDWQWRQCALGGLLFLILVSCGAGVVLILLLVIICCCCCCRQKRPVNSAKLSEMRAEERERLISSSYRSDSSRDYGDDILPPTTLTASPHPRTDARREELSRKYGRTFGNR